MVRSEYIIQQELEEIIKPTLEAVTQEYLPLQYGVAYAVLRAVEENIQSDRPLTIDKEIMERVDPTKHQEMLEGLEFVRQCHTRLTGRAYEGHNLRELLVGVLQKEFCEPCLAQSQAVESLIRLTPEKREAQINALLEPRAVEEERDIKRRAEVEYASTHRLTESAIRTLKTEQGPAFAKMMQEVEAKTQSDMAAWHKREALGYRTAVQLVAAPPSTIKVLLEDYQAAEKKAEEALQAQAASYQRAQIDLNKSAAADNELVKQGVLQPEEAIALDNVSIYLHMYEVQPQTTHALFEMARIANPEKPTDGFYILGEMGYQKSFALVTNPDLLTFIQKQNNPIDLIQRVSLDQLNRASALQVKNAFTVPEIAALTGIIALPEAEMATLTLKTAILDNNKTLLETAISKGADVKVRDERGETPLHYALQRNASPEVIGMLLEKGANVNAADRQGYTPLLDALHYNASPEVIGMLLEKDANVNATTIQGYTPLQIALHYNASPEVIQALLEKGADANAKSIFGGTVLQAAMDTQNAAVIKLITDRLATADHVAPPREQQGQNVPPGSAVSPAHDKGSGRGTERT